MLDGYRDSSVMNILLKFMGIRMEIQTYRYQINFVCKGDLQKSPGPHAGRALAVTKIIHNSFK